MSKFKFFKAAEESLVIEATRRGGLKGYIYFSEEGGAFFRWDTNEGKHLDFFCDKSRNYYSITWFSQIEDLSHLSIAEILTRVRSELLFLEDVMNYIKCNTYESLREVYHA